MSDQAQQPIANDRVARDLAELREEVRLLNKNMAQLMRGVATLLQQSTRKGKMP